LRAAFDTLKGIADHFQITLAGIAQPQLIMQALKQLQTEFIFQRFDLMADRALGHAHFLRGQGKAAVSGGCFESPQRIERR